MKPITPESLLDIVLLDDVRVSPDGTRAAFVRTSVDAPGNTYKRTIWIKDLTSETPAQPFTGSTKDGSPRFSPDGSRLGFVSARSDKPQVFVMNLSGGEARSVASHENGIGGFEWSPDGKRIAFIASLRADEREEEDTKGLEKKSEEPEDKASVFEKAFEKKQDKEKREYVEKMKFDPRTLSRFPYRTGTSFMDGRWAHVYVMDVPQGFSDEDKNDYKPARLTDGEDNFALPTWSADGASLISTYTREIEGPRWYMYTDVVHIPIPSNSGNAAGNAERSLTRLTGDGHSCYSPKVSPNGKWIAFERFKEDRPGHRNQVLAIIPAEDGASAEPVELTASLDRSVEIYKWADDSQHLYFTLLKDGNVQLWRVAVDGGSIEQLTALTHDIQAFDVDANGRIVFIASTAQDPSALYVREVDGTVLCLYKPNRKFLEEHELGEIEEISYTSDEVTIQGWLIKPPNFEEGKQYPLCVEMHGGPHVMWSPSFRSGFHEWQTLAHKGHLVFYCNPRGSDGYGEAFAAANWKDWGPGPARDVLRGVDEIVKRGIVDEKRLTLTGGSYAGYLTAWIIGHDHRFAAACSQRGVYNLISMRGTTDIPFFNDFESGYTPWEDVKNLWDQSPIAHVPNMRTPLLIEHSEQDYRVPIEQGEQLFAAMKLMNKTVEMVRWPREGHELSRSGEPRHRVERIKRIVEWFEKYIRD
jgi:dipeptidyl aminopeptidase/acylaminoacyl peptidase